MKPTTNQKAIYNILTESTGRALGDSGDAYGRHWERNQKRTIEDFMNDPEVSIELTFSKLDGNKPTEHTTLPADPTTTITIYHRDPSPDREEYSEYNYTISLFHWLDKYFTIKTKPKDIDAYLKRKRLQRHYYAHNSCNDNSNLSQVYQLTAIHPEGEEYNIHDDYQYILEVHNGCDERGGYTTPVIVELKKEVACEYVYGSVTYSDGIEYNISNSLDGYRLNLAEYIDPTTGRSESPEIDPDKIGSISLGI